MANCHCEQISHIQSVINNTIKFHIFLDKNGSQFISVSRKLFFNRVNEMHLYHWYWCIDNFVQILKHASYKNSDLYCQLLILNLAFLVWKASSKETTRYINFIHLLNCILCSLTDDFSSYYLTLADSLW